MDLKKLMVKSKSAWVEFPGIEGFEVEVANIPRKELTKIRTACTGQKWDKKARGLVETLDEEKFVEIFASKAVKGWRNLKLKDVASLVLMDIGAEDPEQEVEYSEENAKLLIENSVEFDNWLNDVIFDLDNFRK